MFWPLPTTAATTAILILASVQDTLNKSHEHVKVEAYNREINGDLKEQDQ